MLRLLVSVPSMNVLHTTANARFIVTEDHHFNVLREIPFPSVDVVGIDEFLKEVESLYS